MKFKKILTSLLIAGIFMPQVGGMEDAGGSASASKSLAQLTFECEDIETSIPTMNIDIINSNTYLVAATAAQSLYEYNWPHGNPSIRPDCRNAVGGNCGVQYFHNNQSITVLGSIEYLRTNEEGSVLALLSDRLEKILSMPPQNPGESYMYSCRQSLNPNDLTLRLAIFSGDLATVINVPSSFLDMLRTSKVRVSASQPERTFEIVAIKTGMSHSFKTNRIKGSLTSLEGAQAAERETRLAPQPIPDKISQDLMHELHVSIKGCFTSMD